MVGAERAPWRGRSHRAPWLTGLWYYEPRVPGWDRAGVRQGCRVARRYEVGLVVVGPEAPLAEGVSDSLRAAGFPVFAPSKAAAQLETSKEFAKAFMDRHGIPTAAWSCHEDAESAHAAVSGPCVVKADGLAAGKGVIVAASAEEAHEAVDRMFEGAFGAAGHRVVIEERLTGPEVSVLALCDGSRAVAMLPCRDHKRRFDGDGGPNTGGMGAICPPPDVDAEFIEAVRREVLHPLSTAWRKKVAPSGCTLCRTHADTTGAEGSRVQCPLRRPWCQPLMMMLDEDLVPLMLDCANGRLMDRPLSWRSVLPVAWSWSPEATPARLRRATPLRVSRAPRRMPLHSMPEPNRTKASSSTTAAESLA